MSVIPFKQTKILTRAGVPKKQHKNGTPMGLAAGSIIVVQPFREKRHLEQIREHLKDKPKERLLFELGVSNGLRMVDVLSLKVGQLRGSKVGDVIEVRERKTKKLNYLIIGKNAARWIPRHLAGADLKDEDFIFQGRRTGRMLTTIVAGRMIQGWARACGIKGHYGCHSMRKSWAYHARMQGVAWELISRRLNHTDLEMTRRYLGIHEDEIKSMLLSLKI